MFCDKLTKYAAQENIHIDFCCAEKTTGVTHNLPFVVTDKSVQRFDFELCAICSCTLLDEDTSELNIAQCQNENLSSKQNTEYDRFSFDAIDYMEGHDFESLCAELLIKNGYRNVEVTQGSGDQGIDVIAYKDGIKFGTQCKCYSSDIGNKAVQEAFAGKAHYKCHIGIVLTNRYFTKSAIELADSSGIVLWNRDDLSLLIATASSV